MKKQLLLPAFLLLTSVAFAQKPYFQQDVAYEIKVTLDDVKHELNAFETIVYKNNSPDELTFIYMHLWPNAYKDNHTHMGQQLKEDGSLFFYYADDKDRGYIDGLDFKVDGQSVKLEYLPESIDIGKIILNQPLAPGGQISITTPFHVKLPSGKISRLGHIDQQYQITQWYPKPAVYDKDGWQQIPYLTQGEFYSEFGTFDVYITLPENYVLGSTGDLMDNPKEVAFIDSIWNATKAITKYNAKDNSFPVSSTTLKTLHYHQEHVHDFAWFCDKRYHVLKGEVTLPRTGRKVTTCVMYTNRYASLWKDAIPYVNDALSYYSKWNGDYTYDVCTAVDGALSAGGGMEYPNITVIGAVSNALMLDIVITHEVGHNWFYGMLGSNERVHGWLDEGINSANELRYVETKYPNNALVGGITGPNKLAKKFDLDRYKHRAQYYQLYAFCARTHADQPIETHSKDFTSLNYGSIMYMKSAIIFDYLRSYLGDSLYDHCFQVYFDKWHWKHPGPEDIRAVFETESGKNLSWFFDDLIKTDKQIDYKLAAIPRISDPNNLLPKNEIIVMVKNVGEVNSPVCLNGIKDGKIVKTVWYDGFNGKVGLMFPAGDYDAIMIDQPETIPEVNRKNNTAYTHGLFKKVEPLKIQLAGSLDNPTRTQLFWAPTIGANKYDKFMVGAAFYNHAVPGKKFEWLAMPMYSVGDKSLVGHADAFYHIRPDKVFHDVRIGANLNQYHFYTIRDEDILMGASYVPERRLGWTKVAPEINFDFNKSSARSPISQSVKFRVIYLKTDRINTTFDTMGGSTWAVGYQERTFYEASYSFSNSRSVHPFDFKVTFQTGDFMSKLMLNGNYHINISAKKTIDLRFFAGTFLGAPTSTNDYRFRMSGWSPTGFSNQDYLFDHIFIGRSEHDGLWSQQFAVEDGGFKVYSASGQSDKWLTALNVTVPLPVKNKILGAIKFYGDFGLYNTTGLGSTTFMYDAGVQLVIAKNLLDIYIPLVFSKDIKDYNDIHDVTFPQMIRFSLNLNRMNPFSLLNNLQL